MSKGKYFYRFLALLVTMVSIPASAQDVGLDLLGLQLRGFPVKDVVEFAPDDFVTGHLDWTFGTSLTPIRAVLNTGKILRYRIHFYNGPGLRNGQLGKYEPHFGHTISSFSRAWERGDRKQVEHLKQRVITYCNLFLAYPDVELEMSPTLEHNLTPKAFKRQAKVITTFCPRARVVENPVGGVRTSGGGFKVERHGVKATVSAPCNASLDGDSVEDINLPAYKRKFEKCESTYVWSRVLNCRLASGSFVDPRSRKRNCPSRDHMRTLFEYLKPLGEAPMVVGCRDITTPRLFKPFGDDKGIGDIRANKPLYLTPYLDDLVTVHDAESNKLIGGLEYFGPFDGGGQRYYSGTGSNLTSMEIFDRSRWVVLREGEQCFGPLSPILRMGFFRE